MVKNHENQPIAHTFFNSTFGAIWDSRKIRNVHLFVLKARYRLGPRPFDSLVSRISLQSGFENAIKTLVSRHVFRSDYAHFTDDIAMLQRTLIAGAKKQCPQVYELLALNDGYIEYANSLFFRTSLGDALLKTVIICRLP